MFDKSNIVVLRIALGKSGLYTATSPQLDGVFLAHRNLNAIFEDMPNVIKLWFKSHRDIDVEVFQGPVNREDGHVSMSMIPIPAKIAAEALRG